MRFLPVAVARRLRAHRLQSSQASAWLFCFVRVGGGRPQGECRCKAILTKLPIRTRCSSSSPTHPTPTPRRACRGPCCRRAPPPA
ncbi:hypothetical protein CBM2594_A100159 [Cupriavidus taiwanensis]|uniref:Uncharacterized protein n=1 Tax=Cupriavidus taiwanensis TaxID=164546 RepID=A0A7Z7NKE8_9BURK|nr:hypothetical protein CBM2594_A100159 [Cupriavidus taiwanensis]